MCSYCIFSIYLHSYRTRSTQFIISNFNLIYYEWYCYIIIRFPVQVTWLGYYEARSMEREESKRVAVIGAGLVSDGDIFTFIELKFPCYFKVKCNFYIFTTIISLAICGIIWTVFIVSRQQVVVLGLSVQCSWHIVSRHQLLTTCNRRWNIIALGEKMSLQYFWK